MRCSVLNCRNDHLKGNKSLRFYTFPKDKHRRQLWVEFCGRTDFKPENARVCSEHFLPEDFERNMQFEMGLCKSRGYMLKPGTVPSIIIDPLLLAEVVVVNDAPAPIPVAERKQLVEQILREASLERMRAEEENHKENDTTIGNVADNSQNDDCPIIYASNAITQQMLLEDELKNLKNQNRMLRHENTVLKKAAKRKSKEMLGLNQLVCKLKFEAANVQEKLLQFFTANQIRKLKNGYMKRQLWTREDILKSLTLYSKSAKAYHYLRIKGFPLPSVRTIQAWAKANGISVEEKNEGQLKENGTKKTKRKNNKLTVYGS